MENIQLPEDKPSLLNIINASGFLFQLRVEQEIHRMHQEQDINWAVISQEHRWVDPLSSSENFIDLVLQSSASRMIVECKRVRDAAWVFLIKRGKAAVKRARLLWTYLSKEQGPTVAWDELEISPSLPVSSFCVIRGQGEGDTPMLERLASMVLRSTEVIAEQELEMGTERPCGPAWIYIPVIITNASLYVSRFSFDAIDIQSGTLSDADFEPVPMILFRKALSTTLATNNRAKSLKVVAEEQQRTVFIINAERLQSVLPGFEIHNPGIWPWHGLR